MSKTRNIIVIGIVCFILTFAIFVQIRTIKNTELITSKTSVNTDLRDSAIKWKEKYEQTISSLKEANDNLKNIRTQATQNNPEAMEKDNNLLKNNILLGLTDCSGPGVIITLKDNEGTTNKSIGIEEDIRNYLVHDSNLRKIIRRLKTSGAEAISINEQRVVFSTSIVCSGNVIRVNDEKVGSPFVIKAIGSPELLYGNLEKTVEELNNSGIIVEIEKKDNVDISKYNGTIKQNYVNSIE